MISMLDSVVVVSGCRSDHLACRCATALKVRKADHENRRNAQGSNNVRER